MVILALDDTGLSIKPIDLSPFILGGYVALVVPDVSGEFLNENRFND